MKTLTGLNEKAVIFDEYLASQNAIAPTMKALLTELLTKLPPKDNMESAQIGQLLLGLRSATTDVQIENADYKFVVEKLNANENKMMAQWHSQLLLWIKKFEKE